MGPGGIRLVHVLVATLLLVPLAPPAKAQDTASVVGKVVDDATGDPISGATVLLGGFSDSTDSAGAFQMGGVPYGTYDLKVSRSGYDPHEESVAVSSKTTDLGTIELAPETADVEGRVVDDDGDPIEDATVRMEKGSTVRTKDTDDDGEFTITGLEPGEWEIRVSADGYETFEDEVDVSLPETDLGTIELERETSDVTGRVVDDGTGDAVAGARVQLSGGGPSRQRTTGADGSFSFADVPTGDWDLEVTAAGYARHARSVDVDAPNEALGTVRLASTSAALEGRVVDAENGDPIEGATVQAYAVVGAGNATTGADGTFRIARVAPGPTTVVASAPGHRALLANVTVALPSTDAGDLALVPATREPCRYFGRAVDASSGVAVEGAIVSIAALVTTSDARGVFSLDLPFGAYPLGVTKRGYARHAAPLECSTPSQDLGEIRLVPIPADAPLATLVGRVVTLPGSVPAVGARIDAWHVTSAGALGTSDADHVEGRTGPDGSFALSGLVPGTWIVTAFVPHHAGPTVTRGFPAGDNDLGTFELFVPYGGPARVTGRVVNATSGEPVEGAVAAVATVFRVTGPDGTFDITVASGWYPFRASKVGYAPVERPLLTSAESIELGDVALEPATMPEGTVTIRGRVETRDPTAPAPSARVTVTRSAGPTFVESRDVLADGEARFEFVGLSPGFWSWDAFLAGHASSHGERLLGPGVVDVGTIVLTRPYTGRANITGRVVDASTLAPISGANVRMASVSTLTDAEGRFVVPLSAGHYPFAASAPGYDPVSFSMGTEARNVDLGDVRLAPSGGPFGVVQGVLRENATGVPLEHGVVRVAVDDVAFPAAIEPGGGFHVTGVPAGPFRATLTLDGFAPKTVEGTVPSGGTLDLGTLYLDPGEAGAGDDVSGRVEGTPGLGAALVVVGLGLAAWVGRARGPRGR